MLDISLPVRVKPYVRTSTSLGDLSREAGMALAETALAAALWGTSFPIISLGIKAGLDPRVFIFLRFAIAAPILLGVAVALGRSVTPLLKSKAIWVIGLLNAVGFLCQFIGQKYTEASVAAILVNLSVVMAAVGGVVFLGERLGLSKVAGVILALGGSAMIATNGDLASVAGGEAVGDALYLVAALSWGGYILYSKKKTDETQWDPLAAAASIIAVTAILVFPPALAAGSMPQLSNVSLTAVAYTAVLNTVVPFALYQQGLKYLSASSSAVMLIIEIVVAVLISVAFLGETLTAVGWGGALAVSASIILVSRAEAGGKSLSVHVKDVSRVEDA